MFVEVRLLIPVGAYTAVSGRAEGSSVPLLRVEGESVYLRENTPLVVFFRRLLLKSKLLLAGDGVSVGFRM